MVDEEERVRMDEEVVERILKREEEKEKISEEIEKEKKIGVRGVKWLIIDKKYEVMGDKKKEVMEDEIRKKEEGFEKGIEEER